MREAFVLQKLLIFFQQKILAYVSFEQPGPDNHVSIFFFFFCDILLKRPQNSYKKSGMEHKRYNYRDGSNFTRVMRKNWEKLFFMLVMQDLRVIPAVSTQIFGKR